MTIDDDRRNTARFIQGQFSRYYEKAELDLPPRFTKREFGFFYYGGKGMQRPVAFKTREEVKDFLAKRAPAHAYFSSAYYERPEVPMAEKRWLGADLVFDLDADHVPGAESLSYEGMLARVKEEFIKLIHDFLLRDFGFREDQMDVVFSGGRGYHLHIRENGVLTLDAGQRRAIVDYVTGKNMDWGQFEFSSLKVRAGGWRGKIARGLVELFEGLDAMDPKAAVRTLTKDFNVGKTSAEKLYEKRSGIAMRLRELDGEEKLEYLKARYPDVDAEGLRDLIERRGVLEGDFLASTWERKAVYERIVERQVVQLAGETDEPVTSDVKRLIRMPTSIHGKSSFRVVPLKLKELEAFDPLSDAVVWGDDAVKVDAQRDMSITLKGDAYKIKKGEVAELPTFAAMFFFCRGAAVLRE